MSGKVMGIGGLHRRVGRTLSRAFSSGLLDGLGCVGGMPPTPKAATFMHTKGGLADDLRNVAADLNKVTARLPR